MRVVRFLRGIVFWGIAVLLLAAFVGIIWCDSNGLRAQARVEAKRAVVYRWDTPEPHGSSYQYYADVAFPLDQQAVGVWRWGLTRAGQASLRLSEVPYDQVREGQLVAIRYLPWLPGFVRLEQQPLWQALAVRVSWNRAVQLILWLPVVLCCLYVWQSFRSRGGGRRTLLLALLALVLVGAVQLMTIVPIGPEHATTATVRRLARIAEQPRDDYTMRGPLLQPFVRVEVEFVPAGAAEPIQAIDEIAEGSVPNLREGATVGVTYAAGAPREVLLAGGSRWFLLLNQLPQLGLELLILLIAALWHWWQTKLMPSVPLRQT
jgi:hypothetical protein